MKNYNIYIRKDGRFEGRIYRFEKGKRCYTSFYGKTRSEVETKMRYSLMEQENVSAPTTIMIRDLIEEWIYIMKNKIKASTLSNYRMKLNKHLIPKFGDMICDKLDKKTIYKFIESKTNDGLSMRYISDIIVLLKTIYKYAEREYNIKNVIDGIIMPKKIKPEIKVLNYQEQNVLKKYIDKNPCRTTLGIALSLYTGMRIGEICALRWGDIDMESRVITVRHTIQRIQNYDEGAKTRLIITEPKSSSSIREIPIPACLFHFINSQKSDINSFVLSSDNKPIEPRTMQYRFASILKNAKLPSVHFHSLRHAYATRAVEVGFDIKTLSELLGHSSVELTLNRYVHSSIDRKRACMDKLTWAV